MTIGSLLLELRKTLGSQAATRFTITFIILGMVISSPILILINQTRALATTATTDNANRIDSSRYHSTPHVTGTASPSSSATSKTVAPATLSQDKDFTTQAALSGVWQDRQTIL